MSVAQDLPRHRRRGGCRNALGERTAPTALGSPSSICFLLARWEDRTNMYEVSLLDSVCTEMGIFIGNSYLLVDRT